MDNLENLHRYDAIRDKLPGFEEEMEILRTEQARMIDNYMATSLANRGRKQYGVK